MAGIDTVNFPNSKMGAAIVAGTSRFRVTSADTVRFPNSKMAAAVTLGVSQFRSLETSGPPVAPANLTPPTIAGTTTVGSTLTSTRGTWSGSSATYTYQWKRGVTNVGTNSASYTLVAADISFNMTCVVTATNTAGNASATSNSLGPVTAVLPSNSVLPVISGGMQVGQTITTTDGTWAGTPPITYTYQWKRGGVNVGTSVNSYTLVMADLGATMTVVVTATNVAGNASATSLATGAVVSIPVNTALPVITGTPTQGSLLSTTNGTWLGTATISYSVQWLRDGVAISGGTGSNYVLATADIGTMISAQVTATNSIGSANAISTAVGPIAVNVSPIVLTWTSPASDNTPNYLLDLPPDALIGDIVYLEEADNPGFTGSILDTTDLGSMSGDPIGMESVTVTDGTWYARARINRGIGYGPYSNVVTVTIDTTAPTITSSATFTQPENAAFSTTLTASEAVTWTLTGGIDIAQFSVAGAVLSMAAKDFELPLSVGTPNAYMVQVTATDSVGLTTNQTITVTVTDVIEGGAPRQFIVASMYVNIGGVRSYITPAGYVIEV